MRKEPAGRAPEIPLDVGESLFGALWRRLRRRREERGLGPETARYAGLESRLHAVAQAFAGEPLAIRRAEAAGGAARGVVLLPAVISFAASRAENEAFLYLRAAISGARSRDPERPVEEIVAELCEASPGFAERHASALALDLEVPPRWLWGGELQGADLAAAESARAELAEREARDRDGGVASDASEREAPARDHVRRLALPDEEAKQDMPQHAFEKVMFAEKYGGGARRLDGEDDMDEQGDSLDAVDLRELVRGGPEVHSVYRAELGEPGEIPDISTLEPGERGIAYDEWDRRLGAYRRDWVTLYPAAIPHGDAAGGRELARATATLTRVMLRRLERERHQRRWLDQQTEGSELDLTGIVDDYARRRAGERQTGRVYQHQPRLDRDQATVVLLDVSLSADSWVGGRRVLDATREAACVLGSAADQLGDAMTVLAYASNTRHLCRVWTVQGWGDSWTLARARLAAIQPQGYTRIGPALRHATALLRERPERSRRILILTDGKPTDFDRYEGSHGLADVRMAVREAGRVGARVRAIGLDPRAAVLLPAMFGVGGWAVPRGLQELTEALMKAYGAKA